MTVATTKVDGQLFTAQHYNDLITDIAAVPTSLTDGTSSAPSLAFALDTNLGLYRIGSDNAGFSGSLTIAGVTTGTGWLEVNVTNPTLTNSAFSFGTDQQGMYVDVTYNASAAVLGLGMAASVDVTSGAPVVGAAQALQGRLRVSNASEVYGVTGYVDWEHASALGAGILSIIRGVVSDPGWPNAQNGPIDGINIVSEGNFPASIGLRVFASNLVGNGNKFHIGVDVQSSIESAIRIHNTGWLTGANFSVNSADVRIASVNTSNQVLIGSSGTQVVFSGVVSGITELNANSIYLQAPGSFIELGDPTSATTPYFDFHSSGNAIDYDSRILASGGTGVSGNGAIIITAATLTMSGSTVVISTAAGVTATLQTAGADTNVGLNLLTKGTGAVNISGSTQSIQMGGIGTITRNTTTGALAIATNANGNISLNPGTGGVTTPSGSTLGFFGVTPNARVSAYTPTNVSADRAFDANATTTDELADVLGTLIADLKLYGLLQS